MLRLILTFFLLVTNYGWSASVAEDRAEVVPRTIITLYDSKKYNDVSDAAVHQFLEMPLNHLGYRVWFHDILNGLPDLTDHKDVVGVLTWFPGGMVVPDPKAYLKWAQAVIDMGKRYVVVGNPGFYPADGSVSPDLMNAFWTKLGLYDQAVFVSATYDVNLIKLDPKMLDFERPYGGVLPGYHMIKSQSDTVKVYLAARVRNDPGSDAILVATSPVGGFIAEEYEAYWDNIRDNHRQWYVNPFHFLRVAFGDSGFLKPDTTTLNGRRIFYHHIDGDGWISRTQIAEYKKTRALCAEVIYRNVLKPFDDLPCSVGPIAADLDDSWVGTAESRHWAREILSLPNVEVVVHTLSHPFQWGFFANYTMAEEEPFLYLYPFGSWEGSGIWTRIKHYWMLLLHKPNEENNDGGKPLDEGYDLPRAYANKPFNLHDEVYEAVNKVNEVAPPGKRATLYTWSGDCVPFESAVEDSRKAGVLNLNGGNTRFDSESLSYGWVRPLGRQAGNQRQIYASSSNENIYTEDWTAKFYNYNMLPQTFKNTDVPVRVKPMNLYYHMFSGERRPSLDALLSNVAYVRSQEIIPITATAFARIADSFYNVEIIELSDGRWTVENRGTLQTLRRDHSTLDSVDFGRSVGVIGQRHLLGSLYVALDPVVENPIVAFSACTDCDEEPHANRPYVIESRWQIQDVNTDERNVLSFLAHGYGQGSMTWRVPQPGTYVIQVTKGSQTPTVQRVHTDSVRLNFVVGDGTTLEPVIVTIVRAS